MHVHVRMREGGVAVKTRKKVATLNPSASCMHTLRLEARYSAKRNIVKFAAQYLRQRTIFGKVEISRSPALGAS